MKKIVNVLYAIRIGFRICYIKNDIIIKNQRNRSSNSMLLRYGLSFLQFVYISGSTVCLPNIFLESKDKTYQKNIWHFWRELAEFLHAFPISDLFVYLELLVLTRSVGGSCLGGSTILSIVTSLKEFFKIQ